MLPSVASIASRLRFRQLSLLVALDEHGSLHRASERLAMTQPGLTKALHEIETTFGMPLFVRSAKGIKANELGRCIIRHARLVEADLGHLREEMMGVLRGSGGRLAVGSITGALHSVLISALTSLRAEQPSLSIEVREGTSLELLAQVEQGRLDLAICRTTVAARPEQFVYEALMEEKVAFAVGPQHPLADAASVRLEQLVDCRWMIYPAHMPLHSLLEREFREIGLPVPPYTTETASPLVTMLMLKEDANLVALMSQATMDFCTEHHIACQLPLATRSRHEHYGIVTRQGASPSPVTQLLMQRLRELAVLRQGGVAFVP